MDRRPLASVRSRDEPGAAGAEPALQPSRPTAAPSRLVEAVGVGASLGASRAPGASRRARAPTPSRRRAAALPTPCDRCSGVDGEVLDPGAVAEANRVQVLVGRAEADERSASLGLGDQHAARRGESIAWPQGDGRPALVPLLGPADPGGRTASRRAGTIASAPPPVGCAGSDLERPWALTLAFRPANATQETNLRNPRDFAKPLAIGAPEPVLEVPFKPSRMIHFFDASNEKMAAKVPDMAKQADILLGNLEDAVPVDNKVAAREGLVQVAQGDRLRRDRALDPRQLAREPLGARRPDHPRDRDRRQARRDHGAEGRGRLGHPLRRPPARPARGEGEARAADPRPRDPRDLARRRQPRGDRDRQPADAGDELRAGRPRRLAADEDDPRRRRPPRLPRDRGPRPRRPRGAAGDRPAGPVALLDRAHGRRLHLGRDPALLRPLRRHQGHRRAARRSSAPRSCSAASAPGRCTRSRSRSRRRSSARIPTRSSSPRR